MKNCRNRLTAEGYFIQLLKINGKDQTPASDQGLVMENICSGGFRFITKLKFELEDRVQVLLQFPCGHSQKVLGRICYSEASGQELIAYGFSILEGFYSLQKTAA